MTNFTKLVATLQTRNGLEIICFITGEVMKFDNMKELISKIKKDPMFYRDFFYETSKEIREESDEKYLDFLEVVKIRF